MMNIDEAQFVLPPLTTDQLNTILAALSLYAQNLSDPTEAAKATALADEILEASMRRTASSASGASQRLAPSETTTLWPALSKGGVSEHVILIV